MHIAHLTLPFEYACGISRHVLTLAGAQAQTDRVTVITSGGEAVELLDQAGIPWRRLPVDPARRAPRDMMRAIAAVTRFVKQEQVTILHAHHRYHALLARVVGTLIPRLGIMATCHSLVRGHRLMSYPVPRVIAVSNATRLHLHEYFGIPWDQITVIPNAIPPGAEVGNESIDERVIVPMGGALILGIGRLAPEKGFGTLIEAAHYLRPRVPKPQIVLVGDGPDRMELQHSAQRAPVPVVFVGTIRSVRPYLERATVLVQPSFSETSSLTIIEAGRVGVPVIATNVGGIPEIIQDEVSGLLVNPGNPGELARSIDRMLDDPALTNRLGCGLRRVTDAIAEPAQMAVATRSVYEDLLNAER